MTSRANKKRKGNLGETAEIERALARLDASKKAKPKKLVANGNPRCNDFDEEGRCEGCGQFDCYECGH
jgi:hypothetical protein